MIISGSSAAMAGDGNGGSPATVARNVDGIRYKGEANYMQNS